jgi:hypothetical protein
MTNEKETQGFLKGNFKEQGTWLPAIRLFGIAIIFTVMPFFKSSAQHSMSYAIHANIIYHFTKYVDWPEERKSGDFIIGVVGDTPLFDELKKIIAGKTVGNQKIVIRKFSMSQTAFDSHILFIPEDESSNLKKILAKTTERPVLLVGEEEGMSTRGTCINFVIASDKLKLEINKKNIESRNLSIASELLSLGKIVK